MKIELEKHEQPNGEHQYVVFAGNSCKGLFTETGNDAEKDAEGISIAQRKAETLYQKLVEFYKNGPRKTVLLSTDLGASFEKLKDTLK